MKIWTLDNRFTLQLIIVVSLAFLVFQGCYISRTLDREVKVSFNSDFPVNIINNGVEGFTAKYTSSEFQIAFIEGLEGEFKNNKVIVVESAAEFVVTIDQFNIEETSSEETVNDANSSENGTTYVLTSIDNKSNGSIVSSSKESLGTWAAYKTRNEKVKSRTKKDGTTTHHEQDFTDDAALRFADAAGRRAGARIVNDIHTFLKKQAK